jgi:GT2 family glycosyltransferase
MITRDRVEEAVRAVARLTANDDVAKVVVVDNGSRDGTAATLRSRFSERVDVVALADNLGAAGRNVGVDRVDAPYVAFADDDSWWATGSLARAAELLERHPRIAVVAGRVELTNRGERDPTCALMAHSPLASPVSLPGPSVLGFIACGAVVRRSAFVDVGGFDASLGVGGEEQLLALDLVTAGWQLVYVDDVVARHQPSAVRDIAARQRRVVRNDLWTAWQRRPAASAARVTMSMWRRAGFGEAVRGAPRVLRRRRCVPRQIDIDLRVLEADARIRARATR